MAAPSIPPGTTAASPIPHHGGMAPKVAPIFPMIPSPSPLVFAHVQPPSMSEPDKGHLDTTPSVSPSPSPLSSSAGLPTVQWAILPSLALVLQL
uniref:Uncharacterized protein n=1 Tax=Rhizophora mucronata TaxID=61149 RepID=A0A2P2NRD6_RHIMU